MTGRAAASSRPPRLDNSPLDYAPEKEQGVVFLFAHLARRRFGLRVERVQQGFPDCIAYRAGQRVRIEFEYRSSSFAAHGHDASKCDWIVCWIHDWPSQLAAFLAAALVAQGASAVGATAEAGRWSALILGAGIPAVFVGAWISDRLGRARTAITVGLASGAIGLVFGGLGAIAWPLLIATGFAYSALIAADSAVYSTRVTELAPSARVGSAQAIQAFSGFAMGAVAPVVAGLALDAGLGFGGAFAVAGAASLMGCLPLLAGLRR